MCRILLQSPRNRCGQRRRCILPQTFDRLRFAREMTDKNCLVSIACERRNSGEHLIPYYCKGIDVRTSIDTFFAEGLFRRHVADGAEGNSCSRDSFATASIAER